MRNQIARKLNNIVTIIYLVFYQAEQRGDITGGNALEHVPQDARRHLAQKSASIRLAHRARTKNRKLLERGQSIAHAAASMTRHD